MTNEEIFREFWKNHQWVEPKPVSYRLYYNEQGLPVEYSMQDNPGAWLELTPEQFAMADMRVRVVDGVLTLPPPPAPPRLVVAESGTPCHPWSVLLIVDARQPHRSWRQETYAY